MHTEVAEIFDWLSFPNTNGPRIQQKISHRSNSYFYAGDMRSKSSDILRKSSYTTGKISSNPSVAESFNNDNLYGSYHYKNESMTSTKKTTSADEIPNEIWREVVRFVPVNEKFISRRAAELNSLRIEDFWQLRFVCSGWQSLVDAATEFTLRCQIVPRFGTIRDAWFRLQRRPSAFLINAGLEKIQGSYVLPCIRSISIDVECGKSTEILPIVPTLMELIKQTVPQQCRLEMNLNLQSISAGRCVRNVSTAKNGMAENYPSMLLHSLTFNCEEDHVLRYFICGEGSLRQLHVNVFTFRSALNLMPENWKFQLLEKLKLKVNVDHTGAHQDSRILGAVLSKVPNIRRLDLLSIAFAIGCTSISNLQQLSKLKILYANIQSEPVNHPLKNSTFPREGLSTLKKLTVSALVPSRDSLQLLDSLEQMLHMSNTVEHLRFHEFTIASCHVLCTCIKQGIFHRLKVLQLSTNTVPVVNAQATTALESLLFSLAKHCPRLEKLSLENDSRLPAFERSPGELTILGCLPASLKQAQLEWILKLPELDTTTPAAIIAAIPVCQQFVGDILQLVSRMDNMAMFEAVLISSQQQAKLVEKLADFFKLAKPNQISQGFGHEIQPINTSVTEKQRSIGTGLRAVVCKDYIIDFLLIQAPSEQQTSMNKQRCKRVLLKMTGQAPRRTYD